MLTRNEQAWSLNEVAEHTGTNDYWVTIQGKVYDVTNFVQGDHSDVNGRVSNSQDVLEALAGQDLTYYFPVPLTLGAFAFAEKQFYVLMILAQAARRSSRTPRSS